eukprot:jgi/Tetstr1/453945/TSEL_040864.t1
MKLVLCATHPWNTNGYSLVMTSLAQHLCAFPEMEKIYYFGFQNTTGDDSRNKRVLPDKVEVFDAMAHEVPRKQGFGEDLLAEYIAERDPDVVLISNDSVVVSLLTEKLAAVPNRRFKVMVYQDLVYEHMKRPFVEQLNARADRVLAFTPYWKRHLEEQGVTTPVDVVRHALDPAAKFPVDRAIARRYFGISSTDFIVLNMNRNQPRKRWDICLKAFADFVSRHRGESVKLLIGTSLHGAWDLLAVYERELGKRGMTMEEGRKHLVMLDAPQRLSDADVTILMNCADIGISASDGEGFGLCNFEHAALGCPQVVSNVGGHKDFFSAERAILCDPVMAYYVDRTRDGVGGEAQLIDYRDMAEGIELYYKDPELRRRHGLACREHILANYKWREQAEMLRASILATLAVDGEDDTVTGVADEIDLIPDVSHAPDLIDLSDEPATAPESSAPESAEAAAPGSAGPAVAPELDASAEPAAPEPPPDLAAIRVQLASLTAMVERMCVEGGRENQGH